MWILPQKKERYERKSCRCPLMRKCILYWSKAYIPVDQTTGAITQAVAFQERCQILRKQLLDRLRREYTLSLRDTFNCHRYLFTNHICWLGKILTGHSP